EGSQPGGQLTTTSFIENWPSRAKIMGPELMDKMRKQVVEQDVTFLHDDVVSIDLNSWPYRIQTSDGTYLNALTLIVATGSQPLLLNVPGEKEFWSKGVSTCAVCDAAFYKDKKVIVVGGGDSAVEQALQLAVYASDVQVMVRKDKMRASQAMQEELQKIPTVTVNYNKQVKKVVGNDERVTHVQLYDSEDKTTIELPIDGIFLAIGSKPNTKFLNGQLAVNEGGYIEVDGHSQKTSVPGVFAAGDVEDAVYKQAIVASGEGCKAAMDSQHFLQNAGMSPESLNKIESQYFVEKKKAIAVEIGKISTLAEFETEVANSSIPVILDFYTPMCSSCKYMMPFYEEAAAQLEGKVKFLKVDAEAAKELAAKLVVVKVPTFLVYKQGKLVARYQKVMNKSKLIEFTSQFAQ
ncbi:MAG TPA: FAD-dependent oxidoreductase, partial [Candidatus Babeliales bacterium]|nr:FAD-dependent oxidoreductase [Candidatus Babeliales bacterium]